MMPNLGQGGCQALEDSYVLSTLLCQITDKSQIPSVLQDYYRQRIFRTAVVQGLSRFSSDVIISALSTPFRLNEFAKEGLNYKYLKPQNLVTWYLQPFMPLIFYSQFGFLYSFSPASFNPDDIKNYVSKVVTRNKWEAEQVYSKLAEDCLTYFTAKTMSFMRFNKTTQASSKIADAVDLRVPRSVSLPPSAPVAPMTPAPVA